MTAQIEPKLFFMRPGFAMSCVGHLAVVTIGLMLAGANPFESALTDPITVEIVSPNELETGVAEPEAAPAVAAENAPSLAPAASTQPSQAAPAVAAANGPSFESPASAQRSQPAPSSPSTPAATSTPDQRPTRQALAPTQSMSPPSFVPWLQPPPEPPPAEPPPTAETHELSPGDMFGMPLTLPGGAVGYEPPGEATEKPNISNDVIAEFRSHLKTCSMLPAGVGAEAKVTLRIQLNPDGTLIKSPENPHAVGLVSGLSVGVGDLFMAAKAAVRKCQPYKMLPRDQYEEWKTFDVTFTGANFGGG